MWQRWFREHAIRDDDDRNRHLDYVHYNAVKHGLAACPHAWPYSTFARYVRDGGYEAEWQCACGARRWRPPDFGGMPVGEMEGEYAIRCPEAA